MTWNALLLGGAALVALGLAACGDSAPPANDGGGGDAMSLADARDDASAQGDARDASADVADDKATDHDVARDRDDGGPRDARDADVPDLASDADARDTPDADATPDVREDPFVPPDADPTPDVREDPLVPPDADATIDVRDPDVIDESNVADTSPPPPDGAECTYNGMCPPARPVCSWFKCYAVTAVGVTPSSAAIPSGGTTPFSATVTLSNGLSGNFGLVNWSLAYGTGSGEIDAAGRAKGRSLGTVQISAEFFGVTGTTEATVIAGALERIVVISPPTKVTPGTVYPLRAIGHYSDGATDEVTNQVAWTTGSPTVAILDLANRTVTAGDIGTGSFTATLDNPTFGNVFGVGWLDVSTATLSSLSIYPPNGTYESGLAKGFEANGTYSDGNIAVDLSEGIDWASSNPAVASVIASGPWKGRVQMNGPGTTTISVTLGSVTGSTPLTVTGPALQSVTLSPTTTTLQETKTLQYQLMGAFSDGSSKDLTYSADWSSSNLRAAAFSDAQHQPTVGLLTAIASGTSTITATVGGFSGTSAVTVTR